MDVADDVGAGQAEEVVVAEERLRVGAGGEVVAAKVVLAQLVTLDHGAHRAVEHQDAVGEEFVDGGSGHLVSRTSRQSARAEAPTPVQRGCWPSRRAWLFSCYLAANMPQIAVTAGSSAGKRRRPLELQR